MALPASAGLSSVNQLHLTRSPLLPLPFSTIALGGGDLLRAETKGQWLYKPASTNKTCMTPFWQECSRVI